MIKGRLYANGTRLRITTKFSSYDGKVGSVQFAYESSASKPSGIVYHLTLDDGEAINAVQECLAPEVIWEAR